MGLNKGSLGRYVPPPPPKQQLIKKKRSSALSGKCCMYGLMKIIKLRLILGQIRVSKG